VSNEKVRRTHTEEFYGLCDCHWSVAEVDRELIDRERIYKDLQRRTTTSIPELLNPLALPPTQEHRTY
jgi:hypothetical protein